MNNYHRLFVSFYSYTKANRLQLKSRVDIFCVDNFSRSRQQLAGLGIHCCQPSIVLPKTKDLGMGEGRGDLEQLKC